MVPTTSMHNSSTHASAVVRNCWVVTCWCTLTRLAPHHFTIVTTLHQSALATTRRLPWFPRARPPPLQAALSLHLVYFVCRPHTHCSVCVWIARIASVQNLCFETGLTVLPPSLTHTPRHAPTSPQLDGMGPERATFSLVSSFPLCPVLSFGLHAVVVAMVRVNGVAMQHSRHAVTIRL